jgi:hypothetical protein
MVQGACTDAELSHLREKQEKLREALKLLFDLLEEYAPAWYTEEYRDRAQSALRL